MLKASPGDRAATVTWLLAACRQWLGGDPPATRPPHWSLVGDMARLHQLEPMLHALGPGDTAQTHLPPRELADAWEVTYYRNHLFNTELLELVGAFLGKCRADGLDVVVFKGPVTAARGYGDLALRIMADVDLICWHCDLGRLADHARDLGFRPAPQTATFHLGFFHRDLPAGLELHHDLYDFLSGRRTLVERILETPASLELEGLSLPAPTLEDAFLLDLAHLIQHDFFLPLRAYLDLAAVLGRQQNRIAGGSLQRHLTSYGLGREMSATLAFLRYHFGWPLPAAVGEVPKAETPGYVASVDEALCFPDRIHRQAVLAGPHRKGSVRATASYLLRRLFPPLAELKALSGRSAAATALFTLPTHVATTLCRGLRRWRIGGLHDPRPDSVRREAHRRQDMSR